MPLHILICIKQVPDPERFDRITLDPATGSINRAGIPPVTNPVDRHALEEALRIREALGGSVTVLTMGPPQARKCLDMEDPNNISWFFHWKQWPVLKKLASISDAQITGESGGGIMKFKVPDVLGCPVYFSNEVQLSTQHYNMRLHRQAMACGVPCAVMDVGDSAMIVGDTGRVVSAGDMVGLAESICELLNLTDAEMIDLRCRARARIADLFEIGAIVKQYELLYGELRNPVCAVVRSTLVWCASKLY